MPTVYGTGRGIATRFLRGHLRVVYAAEIDVAPHVLNYVFETTDFPLPCAKD